MSRIKKPTTSGVVPNKTDQIKEIIKCGSDASYFISRYVKISHPTKGTLPFKTFPYQDKCLNSFQKHRFVITNKSRQLGLSTLSAAYSLWMAVFQKEKNILVIATRLEVAKNFIKKVNSMYSNLPKWLVMPQVKAQSVRYLEFSNGSKIQAVPTGTDAGRSEALSLLIIDEAAHVEGIDELWLGLWPTLSCLTGKTKVFTNQGIFDIVDFHKNRKVGEYFKINNWKVYGKNGLEKLSHGYVSPESDVIKLTTRNGYSVEGTLKHPLWVLNHTGGEMKQIQNIAIGDYLRIQIGMNCYGNSEFNGEILNENLAYMLGGYTAEGNMIKGKNAKGETTWNGIQITNFDKDFRSVFLEASKYGLSKDFKPRRQDDKLFCFSIEAANKFKSLGVEPFEKCYDKHVPKCIWTAKKEHMASYLSGLFDGDGSVGTRGVVLNSTSIDLICEIQLLLSNMGFVTNIHHIPSEKILEREKRTGRLLPQGKKVQTLRDSWQLQISRSQLSKFASEIGFRIKRKQQLLLDLANKYNQDDKKLYNIPVSIIGKTIADIKLRFNKSDAWYRQNGVRMDKCKSSSRKGERMVTQSWLRHFREVLKKDGYSETQEETRFFENCLGSFIWSPVVQLKKGIATTYDFTVPATHTFIQNGILGSNTGGSAILISSPSGVGTLFHKIWVGAKEGEDGDGNENPGQGTNNFYRIELPWTVHPERNQQWFEEQRAEIISAKGERGVAQELLCVFNSSGDTFLKTEFLDALENGCAKPIAHYGPAGNVWIWKYAEPDHRYLITADVARGDAGDFSTIQVIDTTKDEQVAEFQGKIPPDDLAELMLDLGFKYNQALLCPELNSFGLMTSTALKKSNYKNLFYEKYSRNIFISHTNDEIKDEMPGLTTSSKTREEMLAKLESVLRNQKIRIYSIRLINEIKTFIWKNNKAQAMKGYNDDLIMSLAIACNLYEAAGTTTYDSLEIAMSMLQGISRKSNFMEKNGSWAEQNTYMPPIIPTNGSVLQTHERMRNNSVNKSQNWNDPILRNFKWVID